MNPQPANEYCAALRRARIQKGWSQRTLAARAGIAERTVTRYELGTTGTPSEDVQRKLARALGVKMDEPGTWPNETPPEPRAAQWPQAADGKLRPPRKKEAPGKSTTVLEVSKEVAEQVKDLCKATGMTRLAMADELLRFALGQVELV